MTDKIRILSTRPLDPPLAAEAAAQDIVLEALSFIETHAAIDEPTDMKIAELSNGPIIAVFTSMNAVDAVAPHLRTAAAGSSPAWKVFCIGSATRQHVQESLGEQCIAGTADSALELARVILGHKEIKEVVFFCGDQRRDELPDQLRAEHIHVRELVVYKTKPTPHTLTHTYDGIVFFSPSAVNSFFSVNTLPAHTVLFAIGRTTADAIRAYAGNQIILSDSPGKNALIRQTIDYFQTKNTRRQPNL